MPRRAAESSGYLIVGRIRKPHGVRGELVVGMESDHPERIFTVGRTLLLGGDDARPLAGSLTIERARPFRDDGMLVRFAGLTTLDASLQALRGRTLLIPEEEAAPLADDEIFYHQLVGMKVMVEGREIGTVRDIFPTASADLLQVMRPGGRELLVPFSGEFVVGWDRVAGVLELDPPPGLMEL